MVDLFLLFFNARANQKIPNLALGLQSTKGLSGFAVFMRK
jgi:hypothetical protein